MEIFPLVLVILSTMAIQGCQAEGCSDRLGMASGSIKKDQITASSSYGSHRPEFARFHGNSAWCVNAKNSSGSYLQVDLGRVMRLTWVGIQGYGARYVTNYTIRYKRREENKNWRPIVERLPTNTTKILSFEGKSSNSSESSFTELRGPRIVRYIRIVLLDGVGEQWCLRLELYGCEWKNKDGLVSYHSAQGNVRGENETEVIMNDATYDGVAKFLGRRYGVLQGGLGQLTDGAIGGNTFWSNLGNGKSFEWVGWFDVVNPKPSILFTFNSPRKFSKILLHGNNRPGNVKIFRNLLVAFSLDGRYFSRKFVFYPSQSLRDRKNESMWIEVDLNGHVGKYMNCEFAYDGKWIVLSEISFESVPSTDHDDQKTPGSTKTDTPTTLMIETQGNSPSLKPVGRGHNDGEFPLSLPTIIAMAIVGFALIVFTVVLIVWLKKRRARGDDRTHPLHNVVRIVNPLKKVSLRREKSKRCSNSSDSDEDVEDMVRKKMNNFVPRNQPWYKSLDRHKMNNMNAQKSWKAEYYMEEKEENADKVDV